MEIATPQPSTPTKRLERGVSIAVCIVLVIEALLSPAVYAAIFLIDAFVSLGDAHAPYHPWVDAMSRLGNAGMLVLFVPLAGSAVVVFLRPTKARVLSAVVCVAAAILNVLAGTALLYYNIASSTGPVGSRIVGCVFGLVFGFVGVWLLVATKDSLAPRATAHPLPPPPP